LTSAASDAPTPAPVPSKDLDITWIIVAVILVIGLVALYFVIQYRKKKRIQEEKKKKKAKKAVKPTIADLEANRKSWVRGQSDGTKEPEDDFAREMERQAEMEQVRALGSAIQMGVKMGLESTNDVHKTVKSVILKKQEKQQETRNSQRIWQSKPDMATAGAEEGTLDEELEQQPGLDLEELDIMTSNLLASRGRKSGGARLSQKGGNGNFILAGWQVRSENIETIEEHGAGAFGALSLVKVGGVRMASKRLDVVASNVSSVHEQQNAMRRLMVETRTLAELQHPNIVRLLGVCTEEGKMCVLTEVAPRGDLRSLLDGCMKEDGVPLSMPLWLRMRMLRDISLAVRHAHAHLPSAIVHRDLQPRNVVVGQDWTARVTEWGLSFGAGEHAPSDAVTAMITPYTPPEVMMLDMDDEDSEDSAEVEDAEPLNREGWNRKGDVYSFGVLAWELIGGNKPWPNHTASSALESLELAELAVTKKLRPSGGEHATVLTVKTGDISTSMPLLTREAGDRNKADAKVDEDKLINGIESCEAIQLIVKCWNADHRKRPSMEEVTKILLDCEIEIAQAGWGEESWMKVSANGDQLDSILGQLEGAGDGRKSTSAADVEMLMAKHKKLAQLAELKALEDANKREKEEGKTEGDEITTSATGIDLTASFANFYKGAFDDSDKSDDEDNNEDSAMGNLDAV